LRRIYCITVFFLGALSTALSQQLFKAIITEDDSVTAMPFVMVINKNTGNGAMSDQYGKFHLVVSPKDTILASFSGYMKLKVPVNSLKVDKNGEVKIVMRKIVYNLPMVDVASFKLKSYERDKMQKVIEDSKIRPVNAMESPITALYMQFSKRGKEQRKLAQIFEEVFIQEQVNKKLNAQILRNLTGDEAINYEEFRKYCLSLSDYYIINHEGYDLYYKVMECYYHWKEERR
jgi:hypothetical protein